MYRHSSAVVGAVELTESSVSSNRLCIEEEGMFVALWIVHSLLLVLLSGAAATTGDYTNQWCVKPNDTSHCTCDPDHCKTLAEYAQDPGRYFTSNTAVIFLSGDHSLNTTLLIGNVTNLAMVGNGGLIQRPNTDLPPEPSSRVNCTTSVAGIHFANIIVLSAQNLTFTNCANVTSNCNNYSALAFVNITNLRVSGIMIRNNSGYGFCGSNLLGDSSIVNSTFAFNNHNSSSYGGNFVVYYSNCSSQRIHHLYVNMSQFLYGYNNLSRGSSFASGLNLVMECTNVDVVIYKSTFIGNIASKGGNINVALSFNNNLDGSIQPVCILNSNITNGTGYVGGGMHVSLVEQPSNTIASCNETKRFLQVENTRFVNNSASYIGGGLYIARAENTQSFCSMSEVTIDSSVFMHNRKGKNSVIGGVALHMANYHIPGYLPRGVPQFRVNITNCSFTENTDERQYRISAAVYTLEQSSTNITDCNFTRNTCTAITAVNSNILFGGNVNIQGNHGNNGGGIVLCDKAMMYFSPNTNMLLAHNRAVMKGGAIYAEDQCLQAKPSCFFQLATNKALDWDVVDTLNVTCTFMNNSAVTAGTAVYGGAINYCYLLSANTTKPYVNSSYVFDKVFHPNNSSGDSSFISSDPIGVCFCTTDGVPDCSNKTMNFTRYPGQTLKASVVVVGQRNGAVSGNVAATVANATLIDSSQCTQYIPSTECSPVKYNLVTNRSSARITLEIKGVDYFFPPVINVTILPCPLGFVSVNSSKGCRCSCAYVAGHTLSCDINGPTIARKSPEWIGCDVITKHILYHEVCPFDYCQPNDVNISTNATTFDQDAQCAFNRRGIMCGKCGNGMSLMLGSYRCDHCSNIYLVLLLPFTIAGLLLVLLIAVCNLTVTEGTINGLIFYANIIQLSSTTIFPTPTRLALTRIIKTSIAWLNLDLGIETCFFDGLDAYLKTWLQFVFPIYIWVIAVVIICLSRRIAFFARLVRRNGIQLLATLFLLSYAKLIDAILMALAFGTIFSSDGSVHTVWLQDGNMLYLSLKHIPLFLFAFALGLLSLIPFVLVLSLIPCWQKVSNRRVLSWLLRMKPFIDAYTGPYKDRNRYWTGLLLVVRIVLFVVHAVNIYGDADMNHLVIASVCFVLLTRSWLFQGGPYWKWTLNALESSLILNLGILCVGTTYFSRHSRGSQEPFTCTMISIAFVVFLSTRIYHTSTTVRSSRVWLRAKRWIARKRHPETVLEPVLEVSEEETTTGASFGESERQMLYWQHVPFDQYREPLLASECNLRK